MSVSSILLALGYIAAVPTFPFIGKMSWRRNLPMFLILELGTAAIVAGWALKGERLPAYLNAGFGVGFLASWVAIGRVRARREEAGQLV